MSKVEKSRALTVRGSNVRIPEGDRRNPIVFLELVVGGHMAMTVAMQNLKNSGLIMRLPSGLEGGPAIRASPELIEAMQRAAVAAIRAHPEAYQHLTAPHPSARPKRAPKRQKEAAA